MTEPTGAEVLRVDDFPTAENLPDRYRDMATTPDQFKRRRVALMQFIKEQLEPAEMDGNKLLRVNDYYKFPGSDKYGLSKKGAEALGALYRYQVMDAGIVEHKCEKDYCYARAKVTLHRGGTVMAVREASCSSAEKSFQRSAAKYTCSGKKDPDWRSADNDIVARAQKRAYVQAMIAACAASDILESADEIDFSKVEDAEFEDVTESPSPASNGGPTVEQLKRATKLLTHKSVTADEREKFADWMNKPTCTAARMEEQLALLEDRINASEEGDGPLG